MKPNQKLLVLLILVSTLSFGQENSKRNYTHSVDILPVPLGSSEFDSSPQDFNPNGVKLFFDSDPNFVNLKFRRILTEALIEVIDGRGKLIENYSGKKIGQVMINMARLRPGQYYVRLTSSEIKDFLKITKN